MRIGSTPLRIVIVGGVSPKTALEQLRWLQLHRAQIGDEHRRGFLLVALGVVVTNIDATERPFHEVASQGHCSLFRRLR